MTVGFPTPKWNFKPSPLALTNTQAPGLCQTPRKWPLVLFAVPLLGPVKAPLSSSPQWEVPFEMCQAMAYPYCIPGFGLAGWPLAAVGRLPGLSSILLEPMAVESHDSINPRIVKAIYHEHMIKMKVKTANRSSSYSLGLVSL